MICSHIRYSSLLKVFISILMNACQLFCTSVCQLPSISTQVAILFTQSDKVVYGTHLKPCTHYVIYNRGLTKLKR